MGRNRGFGLMEVLISLVILSIGLLGMAMLQVKASQYSRGSYGRTQATVLAYDLMDRIRANKPGSDNGAYCLPTSSQTCSTLAAPSTPEYCTSGCGSPNQLAAYDLTQWYQLINSQLVPASVSSTVAREATAVGTATVSKYTITIFWKDHDGDMSQSWEVHI